MSLRFKFSGNSLIDSELVKITIRRQLAHIGHRMERAETHFAAVLSMRDCLFVKSSLKHEFQRELNEPRIHRR